MATVSFAFVSRLPLTPRALSPCRAPSCSKSFHKCAAAQKSRVLRIKQRCPGYGTDSARDVSFAVGNSMRFRYGASGTRISALHGSIPYEVRFKLPGSSGLKVCPCFESSGLRYCLITKDSPAGLWMEPLIFSRKTLPAHQLSSNSVGREWLCCRNSCLNQSMIWSVLKFDGDFFWEQQTGDCATGNGLAVAFESRWKLASLDYLVLPVIGDIFGFI